MMGVGVKVNVWSGGGGRRRDASFSAKTGQMGERRV